MEEIVLHVMSGAGGGGGGQSIIKLFALDAKEIGMKNASADKHLMSSESRPPGPASLSERSSQMGAGRRISYINKT
jgi:hypothetical protein